MPSDEVIILSEEAIRNTAKDFNTTLSRTKIIINILFRRSQNFLSFKIKKITILIMEF